MGRAVVFEKAQGREERGETVGMAGAGLTGARLVVRDWLGIGVLLGNRGGPRIKWRLIRWSVREKALSTCATIWRICARADKPCHKIWTHIFWGIGGLDSIAHILRTGQDLPERS